MSKGFKRAGRPVGEMYKVMDSEEIETQLYMATCKAPRIQTAADWFAAKYPQMDSMSLSTDGLIMRRMALVKSALFDWTASDADNAIWFAMLRFPWSEFGQYQKEPPAWVTEAHQMMLAIKTKWDCDEARAEAAGYILHHLKDARVANALVAWRSTVTPVVRAKMKAVAAKFEVPYGS